MTKPFPIMIASVLLANAGTALAGATPPKPPKSATVGTATLLGSDGSVKGEAKLITEGSDVKLELSVKDLPAGQHGMHLHAIGSCNAPDFASAGSHLNPQGRLHGSLNPKGSHLGDLPNLNVGPDGRSSLTATLTGTPAELVPLLFDRDGTAVVVHASADDYRTDPSGNSGARIACGVLKKSR